jgi:hypothetical protein
VTVECSNCGAGPEAWAALILAALSFVVAIAALVYAKRSADAAAATLALARDETKMARAEHEEFLRTLRARARFKLRFRFTPEADEDGVIRTGGTVIRMRIEILLKNEGERTAGETVVNVVASRGMGLRWSDPRGSELPDATAAAETPEQLTDAEGKVRPAEYLAVTLPKVTLRSWYAKFATLYFDVPAEGEMSVPLRVTAQADELPDDIDEEVEHIMLRVARSRP